jgi:hypothetical protein
MTRARVLGLLLALAAGGIAFAEVQVGETRAVQARSGVPLREEPKALAKVVATVPYGTQVRVLEIQTFFARVSVSTTGATGWVRSADLVEPPVLTGKTPQRTTASAGYASTADVSAAGRQFDDSTEGAYKATRAELAQAYALVDAIEKKSPSPEEVETFIRDGRLGR